MKTKICKICGAEKPRNEFVFQRRTCKVCYNDQRKESRYGIDDWQVKDRPGKYVNDRQRQMTFDMMLIFGWSFNPEKNIWYKEGIKDKNGVWM